MRRARRWSAFGNAGATSARPRGSAPRTRVPRRAQRLASTRRWPGSSKSTTRARTRSAATLGLRVATHVTRARPRARARAARHELAATRVLATGLACRKIGPRLPMLALIACGTRRGRGVRRSRRGGLAQLAIDAGTREALVTQWPDEDTAASRAPSASTKALRPGWSSSSEPAKTCRERRRDRSATARTSGIRLSRSARPRRRSDPGSESKRCAVRRPERWAPRLRSIHRARPRSPRAVLPPKKRSVDSNSAGSRVRVLLRLSSSRTSRAARAAHRDRAFAPSRSTLPCASGSSSRTPQRPARSSTRVSTATRRAELSHRRRRRRRRSRRRPRDRGRPGHAERERRRPCASGPGRPVRRAHRPGRGQRSPATAVLWHSRQRSRSAPPRAGPSEDPRRASAQVVAARTSL